jgi:hypothetical protein
MPGVLPDYAEPIVNAGADGGELTTAEQAHK